MTITSICTRREPETEFVCPTCPPDDNTWPASAFRAWIQAHVRGRPKLPICGACLFARYPRVYRSCTGCGGVMYYHSKRPEQGSGTCRACRAQERVAA